MTQALPGSTRRRLLLSIVALLAVFAAGTAGFDRLTGQPAKAQSAEYTVTIVKYVDGALATTGDFNFHASWQTTNIPSGEGDFPLNAGNAYTHVSAPINAGASLSVTENGIDGTCGTGDTYRLAGYGSGASLAAATVGTGGAVTDIQSNMYIVIYNETCKDEPPPAETGSVTIVKQGLLGNDVADFTSTFAGGASFQLGGANGTSKVFSDVAAGTYSVTETPVPGYTLTGAGCSLDTSRLAPQAAAEGNTLNIVVEAGQAITCTFVNAAAQTIQYDVTITKYVDGSLATEGQFDLTASWNAANLGGAGSGDFSLNSANSWQAVTSPMDAGSSYSVVENGIDADCDDPGDLYRFVGFGEGSTLEAAAADMSADGSFSDLQSDMYIAVHNAPCAPAGTSSITIVKEGLTGEAEASFTHNLPGQDTDTFTLDAVDNSVTFDNLPAGTYSFTEADMEGWHLESFGCETGGPAPLAPSTGTTLNVVLGEDQDLTCTFVNARDTFTFALHKYVDGELATDGTFEFSQTIEEGTPTTLTLGDANGWMETSEAIPSGSMVALTESGIDGTCEQGDTYRFAGFTWGATAEEALAGTPSGTFNMALEGNLHVIAWNELCANLGSITIVKDFEGTPSGDVDASFTGSGSLGNFTLADGEEEVFSGLGAGSYTFTEANMAGWALKSIFCSGQSSPSAITINLGGQSASVELGASEHITCTFTNSEDDTPGPGAITVIKDWVGGTGAGPDATFTTSANFGLTGNTFDLMDATDQDRRLFSDLEPGSYTVTEDAMDGWTVTAINCSSDQTGINWTFGVGDRTFTVNLRADENVTCTVTNTFNGNTGTETPTENVNPPTIVSPFTPPVVELPGTNPVVNPPVNNPVTNNPPVDNSPVTNNPPTAVSPFTPESPVVNNPPTAVDSFSPSTTTGGNQIAGGAAPLPPSTGTTAQAANDNEPWILFASVAVVAGAVAAASYGLRKR